jgi:hypothetical protein
MRSQAVLPTSDKLVMVLKCCDHSQWQEMSTIRGHADRTADASVVLACSRFELWETAPLLRSDLSFVDLLRPRHVKEMTQPSMGYSYLHDGQWPRNIGIHYESHSER